MTHEIDSDRRSYLTSFVLMLALNVPFLIALSAGYPRYAVVVSALIFACLLLYAVRTRIGAFSFRKSELGRTARMFSSDGLLSLLVAPSLFFVISTLNETGPLDSFVRNGALISMALFAMSSLVLSLKRIKF